MLTDAHLHLHKTDNAHDFLKRAKSLGFGRFLSAGTSVADWRACLNMHKKHSEVIPFIGTHPWFSEEHNQQKLFDLLIKHPIAQVGEIGLDGTKETAHQENVFIEQLELAAYLNRTCVIHCVKSFQKLIKIFKNHVHPRTFLVHNFKGGVQEMAFLEKIGGYFSFCTPFSKRQIEVFKKIPLNKILIESDAQENMEQNLGLNLVYFASLKELPVAEFTSVLEKNSASYFENHDGN